MQLDRLSVVVLHCGATVTWIDPTAVDNCDGAIAVVRTDVTGLNSGDLFPAGVTTISYSATDGLGNVSTCSFDVSVNADTEIPVATCMADQSRNADTGSCSYTVIGTELDATAIDNCSGVTLINNFNGSPTLAGAVIPPGVTTVIWTATDANANTGTCQFDITVTDNELPALTCPADISQNEDAGFSYATVIVPDPTISDNCSVSTLTWSMTGATTASSVATGVNQIGTYIFNTGITTVTYNISDAGGNTNTCGFTVTISIPAPLSGSLVSQIDVLCYDGNNGSITVTGVGGSTPYEYSLNSGPYQPSGTFNSLTAGAYIVTVRDVLLNTFDVPVSISGPAAALTVNIVPTDVLCNGGSTGTATATATGGTGPYNYSWNTTPVQTGPAATGLTAGTYTVTITDANSCPATGNVTITQPEALAVTTTQTNVLCNAGADGTATAIPAGGTGPYTYSWNTSPAQTGVTATGLAAGNYSVTVTDANSCSTSGNVSITEPAILSLDPVPTDAGCPDSDDGSITLDITGGTAPYSVIWGDPVTDPVTTPNRTSLLPGTYSVIVADANGCPAGASAEVKYTGSFGCLEIPDIITPDPADMHNDEWIIRNIDIYPNAEVLIYTRWGKLIYQTKNISANPWNGRYSNGRLVPTDSYHYILYLGDGSKPRSGVISVIR